MSVVVRHDVYEAVMEGLAAQWPLGIYTVVDAGHEMFYRPEAVAAIRQLIAAVRDPSLWDCLRHPSGRDPTAVVSRSSSG